MKRFHSVLVKSCLCTLLACALTTSPAFADAPSRRIARFEAWLQVAQSWLSNRLAPTPRASNRYKEEATGGSGGGTTTIPVGENPGPLPMWGSCVDPLGLCGM